MTVPRGFVFFLVSPVADFRHRINHQGHCMYLLNDCSSAPSEYFPGPVVFLPGLFDPFLEIHNTLPMAEGREEMPWAFK